MPNVLIASETMSQIANAIRARAGVSTLFTPSQMPEAIMTIQSGSGNESILSVPSYYRAQTMQIADEIEALSDDWACYTVLTDPHWEMNAGSGVPIANFLSTNTKAKDLCILGDIYVYNNMQEYHTPINLGINKYKSHIHFTVGNHDVYTPEDAIPFEYFYNDYMEDKAAILHGYPEKYWYYYDDNAHKIRNIFINTEDNDMSMLDFVSNALQVPTGWHVAMFGHRDIYEPTDAPFVGGYARASYLIERITAWDGDFIGYFCGHQHVDYRLQFGNKFAHTTLMCDSQDTRDFYPGITQTDRASGTTKENAITIICVNPKTRNVIFKRVGAENTYTGALDYTY